jgi:hypothetical protein
VLAALRGPGTSQEHLGLDGAMRATDPLIREVSRMAGLPVGAGPVALHTSAPKAHRPHGAPPRKS